MTSPPEHRIFIISRARPQNVGPMIQLLQEPLTWVVPPSDHAAYSNAGASTILTVDGLCAARNVALDHAFYEDYYCVQVSDDLGRLSRAHGKKRLDLAVPTAIEWLVDALARSHARLGGIAPTDNPYFSRKLMSRTAFVVGDLIVVKPTPLRFDEALKLKEDYDYTLQHLRQYGEVLRADFILATFKHYTNKGGAVDARTPQVEQETIAYLLKKWPTFLKLNPKRENELLLNWPKE
jgi:hypothetical protein